MRVVSAGGSGGGIPIGVLVAADGAALTAGQHRSGRGLAAGRGSCRRTSVSRASPGRRMGEAQAGGENRAGDNQVKPRDVEHSCTVQHTSDE